MKELLVEFKDGTCLHYKAIFPRLVIAWWNMFGIVTNSPELPSNGTKTIPISNVRYIHIS